MKRKIEKNSKNNANKGKIDTENTKIVKKTNGEIREDLKTITYIVKGTRYIYGNNRTESDIHKRSDPTSYKSNLTIGAKSRTPP